MGGDGGENERPLVDVPAKPPQRNQENGGCSHDFSFLHLPRAELLKAGGLR